LPGLDLRSDAGVHAWAEAILGSHIFDSRGTRQVLHQICDVGAGWPSDAGYVHQQLAVARIEREFDLGHAWLVADAQLDNAALGRSMDAATQAFAHRLDDSFRIRDAQPG
jgi:hypothetical protein